jgi:hypothetical protein
VVLKRLTRHDEYFDRVRKIEPLVMAIFGKDMATIFSKLYEARTRVQSAAEILMQLEGLEIDDKKARQENIELRKTIFASGGKAEEGDEVGRLIESFTANIARICGPLVDEEFGKNRAASYVVVTQK